VLVSTSFMKSLRRRRHGLYLSRWSGKPRYEADTAYRCRRRISGLRALRIGRGGLGLNVYAAGDWICGQSLQDTAAIPKGLSTKHDAEGILRILPEFELGLTDIEGFSHLMVIWAFDRSHGLR